VCAGRVNCRFFQEQEARMVSFPDGLIRHITLKRWYWHALEQLKGDYDLLDEDFTKDSYALALKWFEIDNQDFETELREFFGLVIQQSIYGHYEEQAGISNQNDVMKRGMN